MERTALWRRVIDSKYGSVCSGTQIECRVLMGLVCWKYIRKGLSDFCCFIIFKVGDGSSIKFWHDPWCEGLPSKNNFPEQYNIANNMEASVAELLSFSAGNYHWNINFIQPVQDWELELVVSFMELIFSGSLRRNVTYKICWKLLPRGTFDVRSY